MPGECCFGLPVQVACRRPVYLADPMLCLAPLGASLLGALMRHAEIWLAAEFLSMLDGAGLYDREPELLGIAKSQWAAARQALRRFALLRDEAAESGQLLHWIRDAVRDSCLPGGADARIVQRWQAAAQALDERHCAAENARFPVIAALRDIAALGAVLPGAIVLCARDEPGGAGIPPLLCRQLAAWGVACRPLSAQNPLVASERARLLRIIALAGASTFLWSGLHLSAVHVMVPADLRRPHGPMPAGVATHRSAESHAPRLASWLWEGGQAFWYDVTEDPDHAWN